MTRENRVLIAMCGLITVNQFGFGGIIPVLPLYAQSFGVSASAIGMAVAIYGAARFVVAVPFGNFSDRYGRRPALALGGLISSFGSFWCAIAVSYPEFLVARFFSGAGAGIILTIGQVILADITTPERRGRVIAIYQGCFLFAVGIGPYPGGLLATHFGLAAPFWAYGGASFVAMLIAWFLVPETRAMGHGGKAAQAVSLSFIKQIALLSRQLGYVLASSVSLINAFSRTGGLFMVVPVFAAVTLNLSPDEIGFGLALGSVFGLLTAYPTGMLVDRFGRKAVIVPSTILSGASMLFFLFADSYTGFLVAATIWSVSASIGGSAPAAYAADSAPVGMNAAAMSTFRMVGDFGYVAGPIVLGLMVDVQGTALALGLCAVLNITIGLIFARFAPETYAAVKQAKE